MALLMMEGDSPATARVSHADDSYLRLFGRRAPSPTLLERALRGESVDAEDVRLTLASGGVRLFKCSAAPWRQDGAIRGAVFSVVDRSAEARLAVQQEIARIVMESEDFRSAAPRLLEALGRHLDWSHGSVWISERPGDALICLAHWPPEPAWSDIERIPPGVGLPGRAWDSRHPEWVHDVASESSFPRSADARRHRLGTACGLPIVVEGEVQAVLEFFHREARDPDPEAVETVALLGAHIAQFVRRHRDRAHLARAWRRDHEIASRFQSALWPREPVTVPGYRAAFRYRPVQPEADVGGDFFNLFDLGEGRVGLVIGDVAGKGLEAAVVAAWFQHALVALALREPSAAGVVEGARRLLGTLGFEGLVTLFFGVLETASGHLAYCSAGHEPALVWRADAGRVEELAWGQPALIGCCTEPYVSNETRLGTGDVLLLYTDGLSEAGIRQGRMLGEKGVARILARTHEGEPEDILRALCQAAARPGRGPLRDDLAMLALRRLEAGAADRPVTMRRCATSARGRCDCS